MLRKTLCLLQYCGLDSEVEQLKTKLASVSGQLYYSWTVSESNRRVLVLNYGALFCPFLVQLRAVCFFEVSAEFLFGYAVLIKC